MNAHLKYPWDNQFYFEWNDVVMPALCLERGYFNANQPWLLTKSKTELEQSSASIENTKAAGRLSD